MLACLNFIFEFRAVLVLPKTAGSAQTHKSMSFIWIVWSTLYVYLWAADDKSENESFHFKKDPIFMQSTCLENQAKNYSVKLSRPLLRKETIDYA